MHLSLGITNNCKNLEDSYGVICVRCNQCGRFKTISTEEALKEVEPFYTENEIDQIITK